MTRVRKRTVLIIAGALFLMLAVAFVRYKLSADLYYPRDTVTEADLLGLTTQLELYKRMNGFYPTTEQGLAALIRCPESSPVPKRWDQLIYPKSLIDAWGHPFVYRCPDSRNSSSFDLFSLGADGVESSDDIRVPH